MIKLNNKNITYVALADSSNSLKAPKEIWYADSSNSVKLVYRRKDALIEGVDYEKYHWLKTTEYAYINTKAKGNQDSNVEVIAIQYTQPTTSSLTWYGSVPSDTNKAITFNVGIASSQYKNTRFGNRVVLLRNFDINQEYDVIQNKDALIVNGSTLSNTSATNNFESDEIYIFAPNTRGDISQYLNRELSIRKFVISNDINLIPCKLLKPVPKWLDANGIRRQAGECGMIDLVSGKFYGNVNSVGTFTVENYYERKEWLKGDGNAYIDTGIIVDVPSLYISTSFTKKVGNNTPLFGARDIFSGSGSQIFYLSNGKLRFDIITKGTNWISVNSSNVQNINQLIIDCPNKVININEITLSSGVDDLSIKNSSNTFKIYSLELLNSSDSNNVPYHGAFGNFTLNDSTHSLNLIPCTLTMDLPASMDANNIARTKGTSGMWDLVSDRFYGNVANSGTFKAVNLAEGVDYEVHQWLVGEIPIGVTMLSLPVNSSSFEFKCKFFTPSNCGYFNTSEYFYYKDLGAEAMKIWSSSDYGWASQTTVSDGDLIEIISTPSNTTINGENVPQKGFPITSIRFNQAANAKRQSTKYTSSITIDGIERYIPVKLLKSIPSKYDANGIARQAGECGMYDTVNDLFYGNVASSGTFSVEDDN